MHFQRHSSLIRMWAPKGQQPRVLSASTREKVGFFGALNLKTGALLTREAPTFNGETFGDFLRYLIQVYSRKTAPCSGQCQISQGTDFETVFRSKPRAAHSHLRETFDCEALFLHGGTTKEQRDVMVQRFQADHRGPPLFILSLKAGGLGLNLTAANHVFHFDRWWNPAVENQATDRAFRIGQKRNVQVHKFVCLGTLEERVDQMIEQKKELAESIIGAGEGWLTEMSTDQLREVFALSRAAAQGGVA